MVSQGVSANDNVSFNRVSQGIHTGRSSNVWRQAQHHGWVINGNVRNLLGVDDQHLHLVFSVGNYRVRSHLCSGTGSCVNSNEVSARVFHFANAALFADITVVAGHDANRLRSINRATTAYGDKAVTTFLLVEFRTLANNISGRVWHDLVKGVSGQTSFIQSSIQVIQHAQADQSFIGYDKSFFLLQGWQLCNRISNSTNTGQAL